ncbi:MAG: biotin transporter BioY [Candidatus Puniceispirillaceae bacterium]
MLSATRHDTIMDTMLPAIAGDRRISRLLAQLVFILAGGTLLAASAQFKVMVPPSPVPITGQTLVVLMIGMAFGPRLGAITVIAYILAGLRGLPVFAGGGAGLPVLVGTSGGYLVGFVAAAFVIGLLAQRGMDRSILRTALAMVVGTLVIYLFGFAWLASLIGMEKAFLFGIQPYLWGDAMKLVVAACLMPAAWRGVRAVERMSSDGRD